MVSSEHESDNHRHRLPHGPLLDSVCSCISGIREKFHEVLIYSWPHFLRFQVYPLGHYIQGFYLFPCPSIYFFFFLCHRCLRLILSSTPFSPRPRHLRCRFLRPLHLRVKTLRLCVVSHVGGVMMKVLYQVNCFLSSILTVPITLIVLVSSGMEVRFALKETVR